ncbi:PTS transporter subunit EIIB [Escherichia coli]|uniref:PTS transporter subunit EIIB n=2 Tax=Escherichia coli TaxID=562 RepID=UPI00092FECEE
MAKEISSELLNTILTRVGGPGNIASCGNCMTRLRLGVHDSSLVDPNIKTLEGVKGVILTSDQVQVVFGPGKAHRVACPEHLPERASPWQLTSLSPAADRRQ